MKRKHLLVAAAMLLGIQSFAGTGTDTATANIYKGPIMERPIMAGIHLGTQGIGAFVRYRPLEKLFVRLGFSTMGLNLDREYDLESLNTNFVFDGNFSNIHLWGEFKPSNWSAFRIVGGVSYFFNANTDISIKPSKAYQYNEITVAPEQMGSMSASLDWSGIAPYLGVGFFRTMPKKRLGVNMDLGTYMLPKPKLDLQATGMLQGNEANEAQLQENLKGYRFLPTLQVNIMYKFN